MNLQTVDRVPLLDIPRGNEADHEEIMAAIEEVVKSGWFVGGPNVAKLEEQVCETTGARHAIGCASGSDALLLSLMAADVGPGAEVILPSFTFFATASAAWRLGAKPVFVDIDPVSFNMCPQAFERAISRRTKAVIPVHLFGQCADMDPIMEIARANDIFVVEDAAQAIGAKYDDVGAGAIGDTGCFSFYPTKNLGGLGDGGMVTTNDDALAERVRLLANHGMKPRYYHSEVGINSRLDALQATAISIKMKRIAEISEARRVNAARYDRLFKAMGSGDEIGLPTESNGCYHVWNQYTVRLPNEDRDAFRAKLNENGVGSEVYYPVPLHRQKCFLTLFADPNSLKQTDLAAKEVLSLPIFPEITAEEQNTVVQRVVECLNASKQRTYRMAS